MLCGVSAMAPSGDQKQRPWYRRAARGAVQRDGASAAKTALATIRPPPSTVRAVGSAPPKATDDADAKTTSVSITTEVRLAGNRAAPYCSARLLPRKSVVSAAAGHSHAADGGGAASAPDAVSTDARMPATTAPPMNIASARPSSGWAASRRSITLFKANENPPTMPSQSASERGNGKRSAQEEGAVPVDGGQSTIAAPTRARAMRSAAAADSLSPRTTRASRTVHSGIR